jgi:hypothetical protein
MYECPIFLIIMLENIIAAHIFTWVRASYLT